MKKILITGSTGFIGRNLVEQLRGRYDIAFPNQHELGLLDKKALDNYFKKRQFDAVIHAALYIGPKKTEFGIDMLGKNLTIFFNLVDNKKHFKKLIFFGSGAEYDRRSPIVNIKEDRFGRSVPDYDYGVFKHTISRFIEHLDGFINLRLFGVFGKYEDYQRRPISYTICRALKGLPIIIRQNVVYDYLYIDDLVRIVDYFIHHKPRHKFYNVARGEKIDFIAMAKSVKQITGAKSEVKLLHTGMQNEYSADNSRLMKELGDFKFTDFKASLSQLTEWYRSIINDIEVPDIS